MHIHTLFIYVLEWFEPILIKSYIIPNFPEDYLTWICEMTINSMGSPYSKHYGTITDNQLD